jgi:hypothetical protein
LPLLALGPCLCFLKPKTENSTCHYKSSKKRKKEQVTA